MTNEAGSFDLARRLRDVQAQGRVGEVQRVVILESLSADALRERDRRDSDRLTELLRGPVAVAAATAVELLALEVRVALAEQAPDLRERLAHLHPELGFE